MPRLTTPTALASLIVLALLFVAGALLLADFGESAGPEEGVTLRQVAAEPQDFAGERVVISGQVEELQGFSLADADIVFAIGDDASEKVLVYPQEGAMLPPGFSTDAIVRVTGTVRRVQRNAQTDGGVVQQGRLLAGRDAEAVVEATSITVPGGDLGDEAATPAARQARVEQLVEDPRAWDERPLRVRGTVHRIGSAGFLLADGGASIFVGAPATDLSNLEEGRRVEVRAELERLSRFRANSIPEALAGTPKTAANAAEGVDFDQVPTAAGEPFLVLRTVTPLP